VAIESRGLTDPGCVRGENQDRILIEPALGLYALFDGMGGHQNGGLAAELASAALRYFLDASGDPLDVSWPFGYNFALSADANRLVTAIRLANRQIWQRSSQELECADMGTTVAAVLVNGAQAAIGNVGDSRVYRLRGGELVQITEDDTMVGSMADRGLLTAEEARQHPMRNVLTQAAGSQESIDVHVHEEALVAGDVLLLSSDGLHGVLDREVMAATLLSDEGLDRCVERLIDLTRTAGAPDNVSAIALKYR